MITLTECLPSQSNVEIAFSISLTAEARRRSRQGLEISPNNFVNLCLPRGTILQDGDLLRSETGDTVVQIVAQPEPVITVTGTTQLDLLRAAYHLGNRHVPLEIAEKYLRTIPDPVLSSLLTKLGLKVKEEIAPFHPEIGAYSHNHG